MEKHRSVKGSCDLTTNAIMMKAEYEDLVKCKMEDIISAFQVMKKEMIGCDFEIIVEDKSFFVHKSFLIASSNYFRNFFAETSNNVNASLTTSNVTFDLPVAGVECCIEYMYSGRLTFLDDKNPGTLSVPVLEEVIKASRHMKLDKLTEFCFSCLQRCISVENCLQVIEVLKNYSDEDNVARSNEFVKRNFKRVVQTKNFPNVAEEDLSVYLSMPNLDAELHWKALTAWIGRDAAQKREFFSDKVKKFLEKKTLISLKLLVYDIWPNRYLQSRSSLKNMVLQILSDKILGLSESDPGVEMCFRILEIAKSDGFPNQEKQSIITDYMAERFKQVKSMTGELCRLQISDIQAILSSEYIICDERSKWEVILAWLSVKFGANDPMLESNLFDLLETIDFSKLNSSYIAQMRQHKYVIMSAKCLNLLITKSENVRLLVMDNKTGIKSFDIKNSQHRMLVSFEERCDHITSVGGQPYVLRGKTIFKVMENDLKLVDTLSFKTDPDNWLQFIQFQKSIWIVTKEFILRYSLTTKQSMWQIPCGLGRGFSVTSSEDQIFAVGGTFTHNHAKRFDPKAKKWEKLPDMPMKITDTASAYFKNKLYVIGGSYHGERRSSVVCFANGMWSFIPQMKKDRHKHGAVVFEDRLYVVGGANRFFNGKEPIEAYDDHSNQWKVVGEIDASQGRTSVCVGIAPFHA